MGDFNAKIGVKGQMDKLLDNLAYKKEQNENGEKLIDRCREKNLTITPGLMYIKGKDIFG